MSDTEKTGNVVKNTAFKTKDDWVASVIVENCVTTGEAIEAVAAVKAVKNEDGSILSAAIPAVRGKKGKDELDVDAIKALAAENNLTVKDYPNTGMYRMNIGNMLRAAARKRYGLTINGVWVDAPEGFTVNETKTHNPDGSKIAPAKDDKAA